ncbi:cytochrome P450 [Cercophora newfieldiana]|uniref:Cytochrome P450 n=1 Tax=Cercophora newfieldiana TaxID=92897 RepID=A0AA39YE53_9PEZI|nr:cytochrome P450 [Cercophora newfieldiana]
MAIDPSLGRLWSSGTATTLLILLLTTAIAHLIRGWKRLQHIPGPQFASFSPAWIIKSLSSGQFHEELLKISNQYGPLVRIGSNDLLCTDPDVLRRMSAVRSQYTKGDFYETGRIIPGYNNIVCERDEEKHKALRASMNSAYQGRETGSLLGLEAAVDRQIEKLIALIEEKYVSEPGVLRPFELSAKSQFFALDVIGDHSFGKPFGFLSEDRDLFQYIEINDSAVPIMNMLQAMPWLSNIVYRWPFRLALPSDKDNAGFGRLMGLAKGHVDERLRPGAKPSQDMLQAFSNGGMTYDELIQHMFVQIVAGSITTAATIRHTLLALISTPTTYSRLRQEIDTFFASNPNTTTIPYTSALSLPYLQSVLHESLRFYPPTTGLGSKQVPPQGDIICGYAVPGGTQIAHNFSGIMRLKPIFGDDADVFRPERWLEADEAQKKAMHSVVDLAFGSGKYECMGKRIAMVELNKIFVELLRRYDFALVNPQKPIQVVSGIFWIGKDMWMRVTRRETF